ncbi:MAG: hypothetical protein MZV70_47135 [Desulfobacterales bacterium]|nr:hypothetical protein [Desulfobacterales bacterium]
MKGTKRRDHGSIQSKDLDRKAERYLQGRPGVGRGPAPCRTPTTRWIWSTSSSSSLTLKDTDFHKILRLLRGQRADRAHRGPHRAPWRGFKTGNARTPVLSPPDPGDDPGCLDAGIHRLSADESSAPATSFWPCSRTKQTARMLGGAPIRSKKVSVETLQESLAGHRQGLLPRTARRPRRPAAPGAPEKGKPVGTKALDQFTINLTDQARKAARSTRSWAGISRSGRWWTS